MSRIDLNLDWQMRSEDLSTGGEMQGYVAHQTAGWYQTDLPCDVHMPLIARGIIPEPLEADHSFGCEWIEEKSWWFKKVFQVEPDLLENTVINLVLESLDSDAAVFLNGCALGCQRSTFYPFVYDVKKILHPGENLLVVRVTTGLEQVSDQDLDGLKPFSCTEKAAERGDYRRVALRKPQYVMGWDWGPRLTTCGIPGAVYLQAYQQVAIQSVYVKTKCLAPQAQVTVDVEINHLTDYATAEARLTLELQLGEQRIAVFQQEILLRSGLNWHSQVVVIPDAQLWWPNGMGAQPLYTAVVTVTMGGICEIHPPVHFGIRELQVDMQPQENGERAFAFTINGVKLFCKGANWIPADSVYARVSEEKYETLLHEARNANFNMLRIWGGGIYEQDCFYQKCDEYGILLWHDFMFACALVPDQLPGFCQEVEKELDYQTRRLRNHPAIALWCGNNENHWISEEVWSQDERFHGFGGARIYNEIAPRIVQHNCPEIFYWNSSPYGGVHPNGNDVGDRHHWHDCTMNADMEKRIRPEEYDKVQARFVSEYGYIGPCVKESIQQYHGQIPIDPHSRVWQLHNNTFEKETVPAGIARHYADPQGLNIDEYLLYAGLCQGLMLGYSLEAIRCKDFCGGALFWMYDDCWGEVGWTIIDYYLRRKISYYFVKRTFAPIRLALREENGTIRVFGFNETAEDVRFDVEYGYSNFMGDECQTATTFVELPAFSRQVVLSFPMGEHNLQVGTCFVRPLASTTQVIPALLRTHCFRELVLPPAVLKVTEFAAKGDTARFTVQSNHFAHGVHFSLGEGVLASDEYFDLLPGESRTIELTGNVAHLTADQLVPISVRL